MSNAFSQEQNRLAPPSPRERAAGGREASAIGHSAVGPRLQYAVAGAGHPGRGAERPGRSGRGVQQQARCPRLGTAAAQGCPVASLPSQGRKRETFDAEAAALLQQYHPDFVVLAGYMRILSPAFIQPFAGRILNIHPADTHQHQGLHAYEWAFETS